MNVSGMMKGIQEGMYVVLVLLIGLLSIVITVKTMSGGGTFNNATQIVLIGDFIASSINSLSGMEMGRIEKEFQVPVTVKIYKHERLCFLPFGKECGYYVKVTYKADGKENTYEARILGNVNTNTLVNVKKIYIIKELDKPVEISSSDTEVKECTEPSMEDIKRYVSEACNVYGMDKALVMALIQTESSFHQCVRSGAGAIGLVQLMPSTAKGLGVDPFDARENIQGGVKYLSQMLKMFGDKELAVAAYNAGPGRVKGWRRCIGNNRATWDEIVSNPRIKVLEKPDRNNPCHMARETRNYVPTVFCYYRNCFAKGKDVCNVKCRG